MLVLLASIGSGFKLLAENLKHEVTIMNSSSMALALLLLAKDEFR